MAYQGYIVGELLFTYASYTPHKPFPAYESVHRHHIECLVGKGGNGGYHEIIKGIVVA
ncbi:MAG: hypothetical protein KA095_03445 [Bacteroidales bacterium]|jgi:hypothetical protein|nr:hypothetical protein [Bacteroidales bacterium]